MKSSTDPRHIKRREILKSLFASEFSTQTDSSETVSDILKKKEEINSLIRDAAPTWPIEKINKIDYAILLLSVYEILEAKEPYKVIIDEAVELGKEYGSESSAGFVNGVLGTVFEKIQHE